MLFSSAIILFLAFLIKESIKDDIAFNMLTIIKPAWPTSSARSARRPRRHGCPGGVGCGQNPRVFEEAICAGQDRSRRQGRRAGLAKGLSRG